MLPKLDESKVPERSYGESWTMTLLIEVLPPNCEVLVMIDALLTNDVVIGVEKNDRDQGIEEGKLDPVIGRDDEICRYIQILWRRTKNNSLLIGEPGVGKTTISEGLHSKNSRSGVENGNQ
ncbi:Chaperone protein ClpB4 [Cardamine amara subsp. amara]|uniref:Chaperone protein ClpB4 n=1 Tax=Cardamine amara subsp. amara TaxID=228776 RepID=A0ABD1BGG8_CARAN